MRVVVADTDETRAHAASLIERYFSSWGLESLDDEPELRAELDGLHAYREPEGSLLVAVATTGEPAGVVALKRVDDGTCEMKRMFVEPAWRRRGVGSALVAAIMVRAIDLGYARMRLDTPSWNDPALAMYRSFGLEPIESYLDPDHGHAHDDWAWLGRDLSARARRDLERRLLEAAYLVEDDPRAGSGFTGDESRWEAKRRVILEAIDRDGTLLDACCANGYLMESLERWARADGLKLEPHGLDVSARLVDAARLRLPAWADRIHVGDVVTWEPPRRYDFVYALTDLVGEADLPGLVRRLRDVAVEPGGRLILGIYSRSDARGVLDALQAAGLEPAGHAVGPALADSPSRATTVLWFDA